MKAIVVFDGVCNLCNGAVHFVLKRDRKELFQFAWLQSEAGKELIKKYKEDGGKEESLAVRQESIVLIYGDKIFTRSTAVLLILKMLGRGWNLFYFFRVIPKKIRDAVYNFIGRNRYRWFGKRNECKLPEERYRSRFLV